MYRYRSELKCTGSDPSLSSLVGGGHERWVRSQVQRGGCLGQVRGQTLATAAQVGGCCVGVSCSLSISSSKS